MANLEKRRLADLDCHVITSEKQPLYTVILCHGFGAPGDDLVPIGAQLLEQFQELLDQVQIIFPVGLISLDEIGIPDGRAWWPLDLDQLTGTLQARDYNRFRQELPPQLPHAREQLLRLIDEVCQSTQHPVSNVLLGGFSQGAMLATDVAFHLPTPPAGLVIWSGTLVNETEWSALSSRLHDVPVIQSHGREDAILPYDTAIWLKDLLLAAGAKVNFIGFRGPHTIPREAVNAVGQFLQRLLGTIE